MLIPWICVAALAATAAAQQIVPANTTYDTGLAIVLGGVTGGGQGYELNHFPIAALTAAAQDSNSPLSGWLFLTNNASVTVPSDLNPIIAFITCDAAAGNDEPSNVFNHAVSLHPAAIILYSTTYPSCGVSPPPSSSTVFTMVHQANASEFLQVVASGNAKLASVENLYNSTSAAINTTSTGGNNNNGDNANGLGPSPSTAVAMIILYSITGVITALFLLIIFTGAVRAHRHPERYGPRGGVGMPRQSRARGLAMAMLETIPIVKFGDRTEQTPKPTDVELGSSTHGAVEILPEQGASEQETGTETAGKAQGSDVAAVQSSSATSPPAETGTAAAASRTPSPSSQEPNSNSQEGCSICTEDFQLGEDQRVLPCDHRYHPACIDPWLLNISATCPLCRIDLRPTTSSGASETREEANEELAPPLEEGTSRRRGERRSLFLLGFARPERMTREQRVRALNEYRRAHQGAAEGAEEEGGLRERLRRVLRVRTRRTGEAEQAG